MRDYGYGLWALVVFNSVLFIVFAASFFHPKSSRDWRVMGGFSAFVIALFTEMYGYPLSSTFSPGRCPASFRASISHTTQATCGRT